MDTLFGQQTARLASYSSCIPHGSPVGLAATHLKEADVLAGVGSAEVTWRHSTASSRMDCGATSGAWHLGTLQSKSLRFLPKRIENDDTRHSPNSQFSSIIYRRVLLPIADCSAGCATRWHLPKALTSAGSIGAICQLSSSGVATRRTTTAPGTERSKFAPGRATTISGWSIRRRWDIHRGLGGPPPFSEREEEQERGRGVGCRSTSSDGASVWSEAETHGGGSEDEKFGVKVEATGAARSSDVADDKKEIWKSTAMDWSVAMVAAGTILFGVLNRVTFKLALVPMKNYPFFMAQMSTFGYVVVYFGILYAKRRAGLVTDDMLSLPKTPFALIGLMESMGLAMSMAAGAILPGAVIPILAQTFLVWQLALSSFFLKKRYSGGQILGCVLVIIGVVVVIASGSGASSSLQQAGLFWPLVLVASAAFPAGSSILKEKIFRGAPKRLKGKALDLFVVNSFGSGFQALFVFLMMPLLASLKGIPLLELPSYIRNGGVCFLNLSSELACGGAPWLPLIYMASNLAFNIFALQLLKSSSAIVASLCIAASVPLSSAAFTLPLPLIGQPQPLSPGFFQGSAVLVIGLLLYNLSGQQSKVETIQTVEPTKQG